MATKLTMHQMAQKVWSVIGRAEASKGLSAAEIFSLLQLAYLDIARKLREDLELVNLFEKKTAEFILAGDVTELTDTFATSLMDAFGSPPSNPTVSGTYTGSANAYWVIDITASGTPDTFEWAKNNGVATTGVAITGGAQLLSDGLSITFPSTTAYSVGQAWVLSVARYPTDMIRPFQMNETEMKVDGGEGFSSPSLSNNGERLVMTDNVNFLPRESSAVRQLWNWRNQEIVFNAATQPCKYNLLYEYETTRPTMPADTLAIYDIETATVYAAISRLAGGSELGKVYEDKYTTELNRIIKNEKDRRTPIGGTFGTQ